VSATLKSVALSSPVSVRNYRLFLFGCRGRAYGVRSKAQALQILKAELMLKNCCFLDFFSEVFENVFVSLLGFCHDRADMQKPQARAGAADMGR
jgi:hypothetical protein